MASVPNSDSCSRICIFKNRHSGKVIGLKGKYAVIQTKTRNEKQKWRLISVDSDCDETRYYIKNVAEGTFLDIDDSCESNPLIVSKRTGSLTQQWHVEKDGSIVNVGKQLVVDIYGEKYEEDTPIIAAQKRGTASQVFDLQF